MVTKLFIRNHFENISTVCSAGNQMDAQVAHRSQPNNIYTHTYIVPIVTLWLMRSKCKTRLLKETSNPNSEDIDTQT